MSVDLGELKAELKPLGYGSSVIVFDFPVSELTLKQGVFIKIEGRPGNDLMEISELAHCKGYQISGKYAGFIKIPASSIDEKLGIFPGIRLDGEINDALALSGYSRFLITLSQEGEDPLSSEKVGLNLTGSGKYASLLLSSAKKSRACTETEKAEPSKPDEAVESVQMAKMQDEVLSKPSLHIKKRKNYVAWAIAALVFLAAVAAVIWYLRPQFKTPVSADDNPGNNVLNTDGTAYVQKPLHEAKDDHAVIKTEPCALDKNLDDAAVLSNCMKSNPKSVELEDLSRQALASGRCELAKRLYTGMARAGNKDFALSYAKLLDPKESSDSTCVKKDEKSAAYWYQKTLELDDNNAEASYLLKRLTQKEQP